VKREEERGTIDGTTVIDDFAIIPTACANFESIKESTQAEG